MWVQFSISNKDKIDTITIIITQKTPSLTHICRSIENFSVFVEFNPVYAFPMKNNNHPALLLK